MKPIFFQLRITLFLTSFLFLIILLFTSCHKEPVKSYYDIKGRGYVFDTLNNIPLAGTKVTVQAVVEGEISIISKSNPEIAIYKTDLNGFYEIRFIKKYGNLKISWYYIEIHYNIDGSDNFEVYEVKAEEVKNAKNNILFDPILIPY